MTILTMIMTIMAMTMAMTIMAMTMTMTTMRMTIMAIVLCLRRLLSAETCS